MSLTELWDQRYGSREFAFGTQPNEFLTSAAYWIKPGGRVLLPGDGEGRNGVWLASQGFDVTSVDASPKGCEKARRLAQERHVPLTVVCADLTEWGWPVGEMDAVVSIFLHLPPSTRIQLHGAMRDALRAAGVIIIEAFDQKNLPFRERQPSLGGPTSAELLYTTELLQADFSPLKPTLLESKRVLLNEGIYHVGEGVTVHGVFR